MYTIDDIFSREIEYYYRIYNANGISYKKQKALCFLTSDLKYESTYPDSDGYSYWKRVDDDIRLGRHSFDYIFAIEQGKKDAVEVLNRLTKE